MFKWPGTPSPNACIHELSDYAELVCWQQQSTSITDISADIGRLDENEYSDGVPEKDTLRETVEDAYHEIDRRSKLLGDGYPFELSSQGNALELTRTADDIQRVVYKYLLLATRLNMNDKRIQAGIDGTKVFEEVSSEAAKEYFGRDEADSLVFGTAAGSGNFEEKINDLCKQLKEGIGYNSDGFISVRPNDGKLDVVTWKHFSDEHPGKLIGFGQCKTGTNYKELLTQLQPENFSRWLKRAPAVPPVRMFFVAEALPVNKFHDLSCQAGLLFDRCRVVENCSNLDPELLCKVSSWTDEAARNEIHQ